MAAPANARPRRSGQWRGGEHSKDAVAVHVVLLHPDVDEPVGAARVSERLGWALDEIAGVLDAPTVAYWKATVARCDPRRALVPRRSS